MNISGIGFGGAGGFSLTNISFNSGACGATASMSPTDAMNTTGALSPQMQQLVELMQGLNTAQILMALMLASAGNSDDEENGSGAAMGMLLGLMMASQMNSMQFTFDDAGNVTGMTGGGFNLLV